MNVSSSNWSTYQLTEFLGFLTTFDEERATTLAAIERIAEAVEAEVGVVLDDQSIIATVGCNPEDLKSKDLMQPTASGQDQIELPQIGIARAYGVPLEDNPARKLVIARLAEDPFSADEMNLISGMTRVLQLVLRNIRTIEGEREARTRLQERQVLLERANRALREAERSKDNLLQDIVAGIEQREELERQLRHSQKMEAIGQLAGGIAHDFNNLLSIIINYLEFMRDDLHDEDKLLEDLEEASGAARRASHLTRQLLTMSRRDIAEPKILDLNTLVHDIERFLRRVLPVSIQVTIHPGDDLGQVHADPGHLEQVLMNLVLNARDAMPSGGELTVTTRNVQLSSTVQGVDHELPPGSYVEVAVTDTGCGMDTDTQERIFEPFFTTKSKGEGTGLGLATVYGIVSQSGGSLAVESSPGAGATFRILLPVTEVAAAGTELGSAQGGPHQGRGERILVAEDEEGVRKLVARILRSAGYKVLAAPSGEAAADILDVPEQVVDLLLTDVVMPGMSGKALDEAARRKRPELRTIFMSGYTDQLVAPDDLPPGQDMIAKPFMRQELLEKIEALLNAPLVTSPDSA